jgi:hypothetical protein
VSEHPILQFCFLLANVAITLGYLFLALRVIPNIRVNLRRTKIGGIGFFLLCGATHLHLAFGALFCPTMSLAHMSTSWLMLAIHIPQSICVWLFVTGLYIEVGDWARADRPNLGALASGDEQP